MNKEQLNFELDNFSTLIDVYSAKGQELLEFMTNLDPMHKHYKTIFHLDFNGNVFSYSKEQDDFQRDFYLTNCNSTIGFPDFDYHYHLELCFQADLLAEDSYILDECINSIDEDLCPYMEEDSDDEEDEGRDACFHTSPYYLDTLINRWYSSADEDYYTMYEYMCSGVWYFYSKHLNDLFRNSLSESRLEWIKLSDIRYHYYFSRFWWDFNDELFLLDNPEIVDETYYAPFIEDDPSIMRFDSVNIEELEIDLSPDELVEIYYNEIFEDLSRSRLLLKRCINEINDDNIRDFKMWLIDKFVLKYINNENDHIKYNWTNDLAKSFMKISLDYINENYSIHKDGGGYEHFFLIKCIFYQI